jgi:hypothetical protein
VLKQLPAAFVCGVVFGAFTLVSFSYVWPEALLEYPWSVAFDAVWIATVTAGFIAVFYWHEWHTRDLEPPSVEEEIERQREVRRHVSL